MRFHKEMGDAKKRLEEKGHTVLLPHVEFGDFRKARGKDEKWRRLKQGFIREHFEKIRRADAVLILNYDKDGIESYIGGNSLMELGVAYEYGKQIFILNSVPDGLSYSEEIEVMAPTILDGNLDGFPLAGPPSNRRRRRPRERNAQY
jgi:nucleoside 2-deoxyribosyltransferase